MKQRLPRHVVREVAEPTAAKRLGYAHLVETGLGRGGADLADQREQRIRKAAIGAVQRARFFEQCVVFLVPRQHLLLRERDDAAGGGFHVGWEIEGDGRHCGERVPGNGRRQLRVSA
jgi:hypothetical protein